MRILLTSHAFAPMIGGIETSSQMIAEELSWQGHEVTVATPTPNPEADSYPFEVVRNPSIGQLFRLVRDHDVVLQNNISMRTVWPALLLRWPWFVIIQTWIARTSGQVAWQDRIKLLAIRRATGVISISRAIADHLPVPSTTIPNGYRANVFHSDYPGPRDKDLVFVGRLVSDKGADLLLRAVAALAQDSEPLKPNLAIIGTGPELEDLQRLAGELGIQPQVDFRGPLRDAALAAALNEYKVLAVPSLWREPFGIVALEGLACGCLPVVSDGGGLPHAVGPCGLTFTSGDVGSLATALRAALTDDERVSTLRAEAPSHLSRHSPERIAKDYLSLLAG